MSGGTFTRVMTRPLRKPARPPTAIEKTIASGSGKPNDFQANSEHDRAQADHRADGKVDAAGDDDEGHRQRDEADLGHEPALVEQVVDGEKAVAEGAEADERDRQNDREQRLVPLQPPGRPASARSGRRAHRFHPRAARR